MQRLILLAWFFPLVVGADPARITTQPIESLLLYPETDAPAQVISLNRSTLAAEINAKILDFTVRVGDRVVAGAPLVKLDCRDYQLLLVQAQARLKGIRARLDFAQYRKQKAESLVRSKSVSEETLKLRISEVATFKAEEQSLKSSVEQAQRSVNRCVIKSPFDAILTARFGSVGEQAAPGKSLLTLIEQNNLEAVAQVQSNLVEDLLNSSDVRLAVGEKNYALKVRAAVDSINTGAATREVRLQFVGAKPLSGAAGRLVWRSATAHLPANLLERRQAQLGVFVLAEGKASFHALELAREGRPAVNDLAPGSRLIIDGRVNLEDGEQVSESE